jgi:hypothetical protein
MERNGRYKALEGLRELFRILVWGARMEPQKQPAFRPVGLVRIPAAPERPFRPNVSTDSGDVSSRSGHVSTDSGAPEQRFR